MLFLNTFMNFREFIWNEAIMWSYMGKIEPIYGSGEAQTLNYGTASNFPQPFLYIPLKSHEGWAAILNSIRKNLDRMAVHCEPDANAFGGYRCEKIKPMPGEKNVGYNNTADIMHTGESHVTVAIGSEIKTDPRKILINGKPLFDEKGHGIECPVFPEERKIILGPANSYTTPIDSPPIAALLPVNCPMVGEIRKAMNLPVRDGYKTHITIGYIIPKKDKDGSLTTIGKDKNFPTTKRIHNLTFQQQ